MFTMEAVKHRNSLLGDTVRPPFSLKNINEQSSEQPALPWKQEIELEIACSLIDAESPWF